AVAALESVVANEGRLDRLQTSIAGESFDRHDFLSDVHRGQRQAGIDAAAVDEDRACAAGPLIASLLRASDVEMLAQRVEKARARIELELMHFSVDAQRHRNRVGIRLRLFLRFLAEQGRNEESG